MQGGAPGWGEPRAGGGRTAWRRPRGLWAERRPGVAPVEEFLSLWARAAGSAWGDTRAHGSVRGDTRACGRERAPAFTGEGGGAPRAARRFFLAKAKSLPGHQSPLGSWLVTAVCCCPDPDPDTPPSQPSSKLPPRWPPWPDGLTVLGPTPLRSCFRSCSCLTVLKSQPHLNVTGHFP